MKWIKCSDRLPMEAGIYWVVFKESELSRETAGDCYFIDNEWISGFSDIIYWMKRPDPPIDKSEICKIK